jgi:P4 family phage/plasmid primase-like protien
MIDVAHVRDQILLNLDKVGFENIRKTASKDNERIGGYAYEISCAVLKSDLRMYRREVFAFNGKYYEQFDFAVFHNMIIDILLELNVGMAILVKNNADIVSFCRKRLIQRDIEPTRTIIPFQNCVLDTETMKTSEHSADHDVLYALDYDYAPDDKCPMWEKFLKEVLPGKGLIDVLQEYLGLLFVGRDRLKLEKMLILLGTGANGKSVVFETLIRIIGDNNVSLYDMAQLTKGKSSESNLADIDGKMLNYASDLDVHDFAGGVMKRLISGEPMQARKLYKDPMKLKVIPLFIANANELPETTDKTHGHFRRLLIIPFDVTIAVSKQDNALSTKIRSEYPGILNWILRGTTRIVKNEINFTKCVQIEKASEEYKIIQDSVHGFMKSNKLQEDGTTDDKYWLTDDEIYTNYKLYCEEVGKKPYGKNKFMGILKARLFKPFTNGSERGFIVYCERNPSNSWNKDIGNVYDSVSAVEKPLPEIKVQEDNEPAVFQMKCP